MLTLPSIDSNDKTQLYCQKNYLLSFLVLTRRGEEFCEFVRFESPRRYKSLGGSVWRLHSLSAKTQIEVSSNTPLNTRYQFVNILTNSFTTLGSIKATWKTKQFLDNAMWQFCTILKVEKRRKLGVRKFEIFKKVKLSCSSISLVCPG